MIGPKIIIRMIVSKSNINLMLTDPGMIQKHLFVVEVAGYAMLDEGSELTGAGYLKMKWERNLCGVFLQKNGDFDVLVLEKRSSEEEMIE